MTRSETSVPGVQRDSPSQSASPSTHKAFLGFIAAACCITLTILAFVAVHVASESPASWSDLKFTVSLGIQFGVLGVLPTALAISLAPAKHKIPAAIVCVLLWPIVITALLHWFASLVMNM